LVSGFEGEPEQSDRPLAKASEVLSQLPDDSPFLQLVDFDHGRQELEWKFRPPLLPTTCAPALASPDNVRAGPIDGGVSATASLVGQRRGIAGAGDHQASDNVRVLAAPPAGKPLLR
jgi:hypothetical protein